MRYPGAKRARGVVETIIANIPYHQRYFELFAGTGHIGFLKKEANENYMCDIDEKIQKYLLTKAPLNYKWTICSNTAQYFLCLNFTRNDFIYLDPPYIAESRRSTRKLYTHEMMDEASHIKLLKQIRAIDANIMISTKESAVYDKYLHDWRKIKIKTVDRTGQIYYEVIYMNYPDDCILHQYDYIGKDKGERQANKRTIANLVNKINRQPAHLKQACIKALVENNTDISQHFLNTMHD